MMEAYRDFNEAFSGFTPQQQQALARPAGKPTAALARCLTSLVGTTLTVLLLLSLCRLHCPPSFPSSVAGSQGYLEFDQSTVEALKILFSRDENYVQQLVVDEVSKGGRCD